MSKETSKPNNRLKDVYEPSNYFSNKKLQINKTNYKSFDGFYEGLENVQDDIINKLNMASNNVTNLKNISTYNENEKQQINTNSDKIQNDINLYEEKNINQSTKFDTIDDDGNLLFNNTDINPNIIDAMMKDTRETLIQQNNVYIIGSIISTSIVLGLVMIL
jgi:hypothetical protein